MQDLGDLDGTYSYKFTLRRWESDPDKWNL